MSEPLPMPPDNQYAIDLGHYFFYIWDTRGIPFKQEMQVNERGVTIITPQFGLLTIYGRMIKSRYQEDWSLEADARKRGYIMGEWFSTACVDGEMGSVELVACHEISKAEFSAAYQRGWEVEE